MSRKSRFFGRRDQGVNRSDVLLRLTNSTSDGSDFWVGFLGLFLGCEGL